MKKIITALMLLIGSTLFAQQDALFSQYLFNRLELNPGYAGSREVLSATVTYRNQWVNIDGAPKTINASLHSPLRNDHLALGFNILNDKLGPLSYTGVMSTFAYRILLPYAKLSFGLQAGFKNNGISWSEINSYDLADPSLIYTIKKKVVPDASVGIYYYNDNFYAGISSRQLLQVEAAVVKDTAGRSQFTRLLRHFYFVTGSAVPVSENLVFRPSLLLKYIKNAPPQLDLSASFLYQGTFGLGISYRSGTAMTMYAELGITDNIRIGYSYDMWLNTLKVYNKGSHEVQISFDFDYKKRIRTPRYF